MSHGRLAGDTSSSVAMTNIPTSGLLLAVGIIIGIVANYFGLLFDAIHLRLQVLMYRAAGYTVMGNSLKHIS